MELIKRNEDFKMLSENSQALKDGRYDILPLDLDAYPLFPETKRIADKNFMEESQDSDGAYMLCGHWLSDVSYQFAAACSFTLKVVDSYRSYAYSDKQLAVFTYCEGDVTLTLFTEREAYEKKKSKTIRFHKIVSGEAAAEAMKEGWSKEDAERGYGIFSSPDVGHGATHIEKIDIVGMFSSDDEAAVQAETDGIKIIHDMIFSPEQYANYLDTPENRILLQECSIANDVVPSEEEGAAVK